MFKLGIFQELCRQMHLTKHLTWMACFGGPLWKPTHLLSNMQSLGIPTCWHEAWRHVTTYHKISREIRRQSRTLQAVCPGLAPSCAESWPSNWRPSLSHVCAANKSGIRAISGKSVWMDPCQCKARRRWERLRIILFSLFATYSWRGARRQGTDNSNPSLHFFGFKQPALFVWSCMPSRLSHVIRRTAGRQEPDPWKKTSDFCFRLFPIGSKWFHNFPMQMPKLSELRMIGPIQTYDFHRFIYVQTMYLMLCLPNASFTRYRLRLLWKPRRRHDMASFCFWLQQVVWQCLASVGRIFHDSYQFVSIRYDIFILM